jgi:hypothetical protein
VTHLGCLSSLTLKANLGEVTSLEELMTELMKKHLIGNSIVQALWDIFGEHANV